MLVVERKKECTVLLFQLNPMSMFLWWNLVNEIQQTMARSDAYSGLRMRVWN